MPGLLFVDGRPVAVQLDLEDARFLTFVLRTLQERDARGWLPARAEAIAAACEQVIAGHEMSDSGQAHHDAPDDDPVLTPKQIASQYEVDRRTAQRWCRKFGFEDDGRLFVRRSALEMVR
jgi:peptidoglycan/xylan/chitin deacetylase (PgdA/CDA1 family)